MQDDFILRPRTEASVKRNALIKRYPDGTYQVTCFSRPAYQADGWAAVDAEEERRRRKEFLEAHADLMSGAGERERDRSDNLRRAKQAIYDLAALNDWTYFITLTLDKDHLDRYDPKEVGKRVGKWLANMVQRREGFSYLVVPEHHKDGAIHFHGLISDGLQMIDSGTVKVAGRKKPMKRATAKRQKIPEEQQTPIYNIADYKLGYSSAIPTYGSRDRLSRYMTKYITKDLQKIFGKRYWSSGALKRKPPSFSIDLDYDQMAAQEYKLPYDLGAVKYATMPSIEALNDFLLALQREPLTPSEARGLFHE